MKLFTVLLTHWNMLLWCSLWQKHMQRSPLPLLPLCKQRMLDPLNLSLLLIPQQLEQLESLAGTQMTKYFATGSARQMVMSSIALLEFFKAQEKKKSQNSKYLPYINCFSLAAFDSLLNSWPHLQKNFTLGEMLYYTLSYWPT